MPGKISFIQPNITSLFPGKTPFQEGSFMKNYYFLALALLLLVITPVAADMYYDQTANFFESYGSFSSFGGGRR